MGIDIPIDKYNLNGDTCKIVDYQLNFFIDNKNKYDVSTCCLQINTKINENNGYQIWLRPTLNQQNNIYYFKENISNILRLKNLDKLLTDNAIKLCIYYNGKLGKTLKLENIDSKNLASHNNGH